MSGRILSPVEKNYRRRKSLIESQSRRRVEYVGDLRDPDFVKKEAARLIDLFEQNNILSAIDEYKLGQLISALEGDAFDTTLIELRSILQKLKGVRATVLYHLGGRRRKRLTRRRTRRRIKKQ
jgi:hypothetical protein